MLEDLQYDHPSKVFLGVRFVLLGFDPITKPKVSLSKICYFPFKKKQIFYFFSLNTFNLILLVSIDCAGMSNLTVFHFQVLSKLVDGGGVDVGRYGPICTHVIVDKLIYVIYHSSLCSYTSNFVFVFLGNKFWFLFFWVTLFQFFS